MTVRLNITTFLLAVVALALAAAAPTTAPSTQPADQAGPQKFYGTVTAVDVQAKTFVVDNQTYTIVAETQMTKAADDSPATLADAIVGQPARGTFTRSADGKLNVTKVRFGKKPGGSGKSGG